MGIMLPKPLCMVHGYAYNGACPDGGAAKRRNGIMAKSIGRLSAPVRDRSRSVEARSASVALRRVRAERYTSPQLDLAKLEAELHASGPASLREVSK